MRDHDILQLRTDSDHSRKRDQIKYSLSRNESKLRGLVFRCNADFPPRSAVQNLQSKKPAESNRGGRTFGNRRRFPADSRKLKKVGGPRCFRDHPTLSVNCRPFGYSSDRLLLRRRRQNDGVRAARPASQPSPACFCSVESSDSSAETAAS